MRRQCPDNAGRPQAPTRPTFRTSIALVADGDAEGRRRAGHALQREGGVRVGTLGGRDRRNTNDSAPGVHLNHGSRAARTPMRCR